MSTNFDSLLSIPSDDIKRPPVKPAGTYHAVIAGHVFGESSQKKTPYCRFSFSNMQPGEDIDQDSMKGEDGSPLDLSTWKPSTSGLSDFYLTKDALFRLKEFLDDLKIPGGARPLSERIPETRNLPVIVTISMTPTQDGKSFVNRVESVRAG